MFIKEFSRIVRENPCAIAIEEAGKRITFAELSDQAQKISSFLRSHGVGPETLVALHVPKSASYIALMLGLWMARGAFMPLPTDLPSERKKQMLQIAKPDLLLTETEPSFETDIPIYGLCAIEKHQERFIDEHRQESDLAYVITTSGSTGQPKGVMVEHKGLVSVICQQIELTMLGVGQRSLFMLSTAFDASISDIGTALLSGATLCIEPIENLYPPSRLIETIERLKINYVDMPPSVLAQLNVESKPPSLHTILIGGEICPVPIVQKWARKLRLINVYGPTEATICTSMVLCDPEQWTEPFIGFPLSGVNYRIINAKGTEAGPDEIGELYISGAHLARGYRHNDKMTSESFVLRDGVRFYRTKDNVRARSNGNPVFIGRVDRQIKIRGQLVAPEEIEARLKQRRDIERAVVHQCTLCRGKELLVAFVQPKEKKELDAAELMQDLQAIFPQWMVPQRVVQVEAFPLLPSGKVDVIKLQSFLVEEGKEPDQERLTEKESQLLSVVQKILQITKVSVHDEFFAAGGDSISALDLIYSAENVGVTLTPSLLAKRLTFRELAAETEWAAHENGIDTKILDADALLPDDIANNKPVSEPHFERVKAVLVTGATGFLGARLVYELLKRSDAVVYCLVRAKDDDGALARLLKALSQTELVLSEQDLSRIVAVRGDVEKQRLGLSDVNWGQLSTIIDVVYHCAARVNMFLPYQDLKSANVDACLNVARFCLAGRIKQLEYAGTLSVFVATDRNTGRALEADDLSQTKKVYGGYAQSKWVAERLMHRLSAILPTTIYRFGLITPDVQAGVTNGNEQLALFIRGLIKGGCVPVGQDNSLAFDVTPRDYAAAAMAYISLNAKDHKRIYHIANDISVRLIDLVQALEEEGYSLKKPQTSAWSSVADQYSDGRVGLSLCRVSGHFEKQRGFDLFQATGIVFDSTHTKAALAGSGLICPRPSNDLLRLYIRVAMSQDQLQDEKGY